MIVSIHTMSYLQELVLFRQTVWPVSITVRLHGKVSRQDEEGNDGQKARAGYGEPQRVQQALQGRGPRPEERVRLRDGWDGGFDPRRTWGTQKVRVRQHLDRI